MINLSIMSGATALEAPVLPSVAADPLQPGRLAGRLHAFPRRPRPLGELDQGLMSAGEAPQWHCQLDALYPE